MTSLSKCTCTFCFSQRNCESLTVICKMTYYFSALKSIKTQISNFICALIVIISQRIQRFIFKVCKKFICLISSNFSDSSSKVVSTDIISFATENSHVEAYELNLSAAFNTDELKLFSVSLKRRQSDCLSNYKKSLSYCESENKITNYSAMIYNCLKTDSNLKLNSYKINTL